MCRSVTHKGVEYEKRLITGIARRYRMSRCGAVQSVQVPASERKASPSYWNVVIGSPDPWHGLCDRPDTSASFALV